MCTAQSQRECQRAPLLCRQAKQHRVYCRMQTTQQFIVLRWSGGIAVAPAVCEHALRAVRYLIPSSRESSSNRRSIAIYLFEYYFLFLFDCPTPETGPTWAN